MGDNVQISGGDRFDNLRKELEGKLEKLDQKLNQDIKEKVQFKYFAMFVVFLCGVLGYFTVQISQISDIKLKIAVIEDRVDGILKIKH